MNPDHDFLAANWPAPASIRAGTTLRTGGTSAGLFASLNLGLHTGDAAAAVRENRARIRAALALPDEPAWLNQVHGSVVADLDGGYAGPADAAVATRPGRIAAVMTADCLPVAFCNSAGSCWGVAHAGWRGLTSGVLEATVAALPAAPADVLAWLGPAIGPGNFEVGQDVYDAFCARDPGCAQWFKATASPAQYLADIYGLARRRLQAAGLARIYGGSLCTVADRIRFYSHRRDGHTGRMATLVWLNY
jgi:YfiH family protein